MPDRTGTDRDKVAQGIAIHAGKLRREAGIGCLVPHSAGSKTT